ncbi:TlpA family protein disulfide reductase [Bradyrhizobium sp. 180]|uniref:TlpA disulfide reductase family protein n=1 Tax=unclassified Bradyrhizobium TaxID=2631580 RepID=UPI001FF8D379|nr:MULTISPECIES: TlpA disulfide reductase family protein [unclassified Bradyrhizobium]MCK1492167.1 TlpA family protein disulfide reductase [Bradyrhizobium sp. 180]MCK1719519.1 TlpA family protein disulfide reductase [Bradyrhizobium sp. 141]
MGAVAFGPFVFPVEYFAAILAAVLVLSLGWYLAEKVDARLHPMPVRVICAFVLGARLGHVVAHWPSFAAELSRVFAFWQGGFYWPVGVAAAIIVNVVVLRHPRAIAWSAIPLGSAAAAAAMTVYLLAGLPSAPLPGDAFETADGRVVVPQSLKGRKLVINLWASWCPPCRNELPMMAEFAHADHSAEFLFANQGEDISAIQSFLQARGIVLDTVLLDKYGSMAQNYQIRGLPTTLFINTDGNVKSVNIGELSKENLSNAVAELN